LRLVSVSKVVKAACNALINSAGVPPSFRPIRCHGCVNKAWIKDDAVGVLGAGFAFELFIDQKAKVLISSLSRSICAEIGGPFLGCDRAHMHDTESRWLTLVSLRLLSLL